MGTIFRNRPRSSTADGQEYVEENNDAYNATSVCNKCGKEF